MSSLMGSLLFVTRNPDPNRRLAETLQRRQTPFFVTLYSGYSIDGLAASIRVGRGVA